VAVIDDDEAVRAVLIRGLADAGFDVGEASDGLTGLALIGARLPEVAVIDFMMPGMNGAEVARRAQIAQPGLPIVFVSGYSDTLALDGIAGATVLRKPFDAEALLAAVERALGG
jgi:DNA-binding response OmpR family regulator